MNFVHPEAFLLLLLLPLALESGFRQRFFRIFKRNSGASIAERNSLPFASPVTFSELVTLAEKGSWRSRTRGVVLSLLTAGAMCAFVFALSRPQHGNEFTEIEESGRDIMLVLDTSGSMLAVDFFIDGERVTRLDALKKVVTDFIAKRQGDRLGMVVFGDTAFTQCPLTTDTAAITEYLNALEVAMAGKATAIGDAIGVALKRIRGIEAQSKVIILVTDGKNNAGTLQPKEGAELAKKLGITIHVVGVGSNGPAPFEVTTMFGVRATVQQDMEYDEKSLKEIAEITGGKYFNAKSTEKLQEIYSEIDKLEERVAKSHRVIEYEERYQMALLFGLLLLCAAEVLGATFYLKVP